MTEYKLTEQEIDFCNLFIYGGFGVAGDMNVCYREAFGLESKRDARIIASNPNVKERIKELIEEFKTNEENQAFAMQIQITDTLQKVMKETSTDIYRTSKGHAISPAPLRAVAVNSAKSLADIYIKKPSQSHDVNLSAGGEGGLKLNIIVPQSVVPDDQKD